MTPAELRSVLADLTPQNQDKRFLVVSRSAPRSTPEQYFPDDSSVEWLSDIHSADDIGVIERADLTIVFDQLEHMEKTAGVHLLSRLRDLHSKRVLLHCADQVHSKQELLALGFIERNHPSEDGRLFLFDPHLFFERRDWNTPDKWAHPENFNKHRW